MLPGCRNFLAAMLGRSSVDFTTTIYTAMDCTNSSCRSCVHHIHLRHGSRSRRFSDAYSQARRCRVPPVITESETTTERGKQTKMTTDAIFESPPPTQHERVRERCPTALETTTQIGICVHVSECPEPPSEHCRNHSKYDHGKMRCPKPEATIECLVYQCSLALVSPDFKIPDTCNSSESSTWSFICELRTSRVVLR